MPRYFFDRTDGTRKQDEFGVELPSLAAAQTAALHHASKTVGFDGQNLWTEKHMRVEVRDVMRRLIFTLVLSVEDAPIYADPLLSRT